MCVGGSAEIDFGKHVGDKAKDEKDDADEETEHRELGERGAGQILTKKYLAENRPHSGESGDEHKEDADATEEVQRAVGVFLPEPNREHVEDAFNAALPVVFGLAGGAGAMVDHFFANLKALDL